MLTSFIPYMLLSPTYVNVLNVYAFCNLDDVRSRCHTQYFLLFLTTHRTSQISWGTKQQTDQPPLDLGAVTQNSASQVDVEVLADITDANEMYEESLSNLRDRKPVHDEVNGGSGFDREQAAKDYYSSVRTNVSTNCRHWGKSDFEHEM